MPYPLVTCDFQEQPVTERRKIWALRLLALTLALASWVFITSERTATTTETVETTFEPSIQYNNPVGSDLIVLEPVLRAKVRLRGPTTLVSSINPAQVSVVVDLRDAEQGVFEAPLGPTNVIRPAGLEVLSVEPNLLTLEIDRITTEFRRVAPRLEGEPAAGAIARSPEVVPPEVLVRGPASLLAGIETLSTRPILLDGHALDFEENVVVVSPSPLVQVVNPAVVLVRVPLEIPNTGEGAAP